MNRFYFKTDGVTYEVDDIQEGYDDVDASSEILQTTVEVHDAPMTTSESKAAASAGLLKRDEDYLAPGKDG